MKPHVWEIETVDGGSVGLADFWHCHDCDAAGGPVWPSRNAPGHLPPPSLPPFLADGCGLQVSEDCDEARQAIIEHRRTGAHAQFLLKLKDN